MDHEQLFTQGFNSGYLLAKYEPQIADHIVKINGAKGEYYNGLLSGRSEYLLEKAKNKLKNKSVNKAGKVRGAKRRK